jgi:hypothetical protein
MSLNDSLLTATSSTSTASTSSARAGPSTAAADREWLASWGTRVGQELESKVLAAVNRTTLVRITFAVLFLRIFCM